MDGFPVLCKNYPFHSAGTCHFVGMKALWIVLGVLALVAAAVVIIVVWAVGSYNSLVASSQNVDAKWAQVQNVYQRRADLVPNLVKTVEGSANFEKSTLAEVIQARASVGRVTIDASKAPSEAAQLAEFQKAQGSLSNALSRLMVVSEQYPDLKASAGFRDLQVQLEGTENRISVERGRFNEAVQAYNVQIKSLPTVFYAAFLGFKEKPYFAASEGADKAPEVQFNFGGGAKPQ